MLKLYYSKGVCSLAVRITLHELNISCIYESVNLKTKHTETGIDYLTINPKGSVPALLLTNNEILTENAVILQYLADTFEPIKFLPPVGNMNRYRALEWLNFVSTDLHRYCAPLFWFKMPDEVKQSLFMPVLIKKLSIAENGLENNVFLMGDTLTLADGYLFVILTWLAKLNFNMQDFPNLLRYFFDMKKRRSVIQSLEEEGLENLHFPL